MGVGQSVPLCSGRQSVPLCPGVPLARKPAEILGWAGAQAGAQGVPLWAPAVKFAARVRLCDSPRKPAEILGRAGCAQSLT
jgi:hypothetical protein